MGEEVVTNKESKHVSYSQFTTWLNCKRSWELKYKNKIPSFTSNIHNIFGTAMHETIQSYLTELYNSKKTISEVDGFDWKEVLKKNISKEYGEKRTMNENKDFVTLDDLREIYSDGSKIIDEFIWLRKKFFRKDKVKLIGIETELNIELKKNVSFKGFVDVIIHDEREDKYYIIDLKTSLNGWTDKTKKDPIKRLQLLLYKKFFSEKWNIPIEKIDCYFLILKRKIMEHVSFKTYRIQSVSIPNSERTINSEYKAFNSFLEECFDSEGKYIDGDYPIAQYATSCKYCPFYYKNAKTEHLKMCSKWDAKSNLILLNESNKSKEE